MAKRSGKSAKWQRQMRAAERNHRDKQGDHAKAKLTYDQEYMQRIYYQISRGRLAAKG
jgi:hypothetical protein